MHITTIWEATNKKTFFSDSNLLHITNFDKLERPSWFVELSASQ